MVLVGDYHTAKDLVQTVFIQLWENQKIEEVEKLEPYLIKCVKYKCMDYLKQPQRKKEVFQTTLPELGSVEIQTFKEEDILPMLHFFADKLPPKMQKVFLMSRDQGLSYKEIAQSLDISIKTVENQMGAALKKMRVLLKKQHYLSISILLVQ